MHAIVDSIHCEIRNAIHSVIDRDNAAAPFNQGVRHAEFLDNWAAQVSLTLQIDEKATANPTFSWTPASLFTLGASASLSADATRIDKINYFYGVKDLYVMDVCPPDFTEPHPTGSLFIQSDLKLKEWLADQVLNVGTGATSVPQSVNTPLKQNVLSHEVKFEIVSTAGLTPGWKLHSLSGSINQAHCLRSTRDRLHDLLNFHNVGPYRSYPTGHSRSNSTGIVSSLPNRYRIVGRC